jgi:hypothetical protein
MQVKPRRRDPRPRRRAAPNPGATQSAPRPPPSPARREPGARDGERGRLGKGRATGRFRPFAAPHPKKPAYFGNKPGTTPKKPAFFARKSWSDPIRIV